MLTNFDYLKQESKFSKFADVAISAEKLILLDPEASIMNSRRAMEFAIKWMYSVDDELEMPYQDNLQSLMSAEEYRQIVGPDLWKRMDYIRRCGNNVAHGGKKLGKDEAMLCLENLFIYLDYIAMRITMSNGHLIRILLQHELRRQENPGKWQVRRRKNCFGSRRSLRSRN